MDKNPFDTELCSNRLTLNRLMIADANAMFEYTCIGEVTKHLSWDEHENIEQTISYLKNIVSSYGTDIKTYTWAIRLNEINKMIGVVRVFEISYSNRRGELSYIMNPRYQGCGYMKEALRLVIDRCKKIGLYRIQARCAVDNVASEKVMIGVGMKLEGVLKSYWIQKGQVKDVKIYAIV